MSTSFVEPVVDLDSSSEIRTLPDLVEFHIEHNPEYPFCIQTEKRDPTGPHSLIKVTYRRLGEALRRCRSWVGHHVPHDQISPPLFRPNGAVKSPPVALFMESDVRLAVFILTFLSRGVPIVLLSTRLSPLAVRHLVQVTGARTAVVSPQLRATFSRALSGSTSAQGEPGDEQINEDDLDISVHVPEPYETLLEGEPQHATPVDSVVDSRHYVSEEDRQVMILHSSGTSGLPKPIHCSHRHFLQYARCHEFDSPIERQGLTISTSPFFHGFGMFPICMSLGIGKPFCILPSSVPPTGLSVIDAIEASRASSLLTVPSIIEDMALVPDARGFKALGQLHFVAFGGGLPKESVGQELQAAGVRLINHYGATETGPLSPFFVPPMGHDWHFIRLRKDTRNVLDVRLDQESGPDIPNNAYRLSMRPFGWTERFVLQDLLVLNSGGNAGDLSSAEWSIGGRTDDLICLATGEKVRPTILESCLRQCQGVKAAVAFGDGEFELGVLVEPETDNLSIDDERHFRRLLWNAAQQAGQQMDAHARLTSPDSILIVSPGSLPRSDKGTILRREVSRVFAKDIAKVYRQLERGDAGVFDFDPSSPATSIRSIIEATVEWRDPDLKWSDDDDFFTLGMDSLQAIKLRRALMASLQAVSTRSNVNDEPAFSASKLGQDMIYRFPSVNGLAKVIGCDGSINGDESYGTDEQILTSLVNKYSGREVRPDAVHSKVILMTGSTGSLGSYLAARLVADPSVAKVVCLTRPSRDGPMDRQRIAFSDRKIILTPEQWLKISVIATSTDALHLGLDDADYRTLLALPSPVTHIIHVAWPMNFNLQLSSYQASFKTVQNLVKLAVDAHAAHPTLRPRLLFASSISTVGNHPSATSALIESPSTKDLIPEKLVDSASTLALGYAKAKLVCERLIANAATNHPQIEVGFVRIGQIAGSTANGGYWNIDEHFVALVRSAKAIGRFPDLKGTLSWLPVNVAADAIAEMISHHEPLQLVYHLENPSRQSWAEMVELLTEDLGLSVVAFSQWLDLVERTPEQANPAKALVGFLGQEFEKMSCGQVVLDTTASRSVSPTLRALEAIKPEQARAYLEYWREVGALS